MLLSLFAAGYYDASSDIQERSQAAEIDIRRLIGMINDLIDIEKLESPSLRLSLEKTCVQDIIFIFLPYVLMRSIVRNKRGKNWAENKKREFSSAKRSVMMATAPFWYLHSPG